MHLFLGLQAIPSNRGTSIPAGRTKCRFCLTSHVKPFDVDDIADEASLLHVIHMVVPATSGYAAIAKGTTAAWCVPRNDRTIYRLWAGRQSQRRISAPIRETVGCASGGGIDHRARPAVPHDRS